MALLHLLLQVVVAAVCGVILGLDYELRGRPGGVRAHMLATVGAALFCMAGTNIAATPAETLRIVQGVASGVGFIGAATVLRGDGRIQGVANAASFWIAGALGCKVGLGDLIGALVIAVLVASLAKISCRLEGRWPRSAGSGPPSSSSDPEEQRSPSWPWQDRT
jgi:putative Mg2+ transporter-C (MgtC) family protein